MTIKEITAQQQVRTQGEINLFKLTNDALNNLCILNPALYCALFYCECGYFPYETGLEVLWKANRYLKKMKERQLPVLRNMQLQQLRATDKMNRLRILSPTIYQKKIMGKC